MGPFTVVWKYHYDFDFRIEQWGSQEEAFGRAQELMQLNNVAMIQVLNCTVVLFWPE